ncbi:fatty acyl-CoA reductase 3-like [Oryza brachyantha]|uniref:fatty acyl-CoA reductase 3-like n=1 Tax=Oryza brachyantha TaxID=4533 RepID=UPI001ADA0820|nr:fatty acyl-CoA reductase 3-like [Oryza brachyantha]
MDTTAIVGCFRNRSILITGSTGYLGKLLVEKMLRVQPEVRKLYLLVRAPDAAAAEQRIVDNDLFDVLREQHGADFQSVKNKIRPLAGDMSKENFGLGSSEIVHMSLQDVDAIVNSAATTNFYNRYDVALASNTTSVSHICEFAHKCPRLKMLLHVSTAYLTGYEVGLLPENLFQIGEARREGCHLDIEAEVQLMHKVKSQLRMSSSDDKLEKKTMKDLGLERAKHFGWQNTYVFTKAMGEMFLGHLGQDLPVVIVRPSIVTSTIKDPMPGWIDGLTRGLDTIIVGYNYQKLPCFVVDDDAFIHAIPGDMVINAMMVAMATHWGKPAHVLYNVSSPLHASVVLESMYSSFRTNPRTRANGRIIKNKRIPMFKKFADFRAYMILRYKLPLELLHSVNVLLGGVFDQYYRKAHKGYNSLMLLAKLYAPFSLFKGCFDNTNLKKLSMAMATSCENDDASSLFHLDTSCINWSSYLINIHIPAVLEFANASTQEKKAGRS